MSVVELRLPEGINQREDIELPLSKSIALRAMTLNIASQLLGHGSLGRMTLPESEDIDGMLRAIAVFETNHGVGTHTVHIGAGGAPFRFFTALAASVAGCDVTVTADPALMKRPNAPLFEALRRAGGEIRCLENEGYAPIRIFGKDLDPDCLEVDASMSSQYLSAILMAAPLWRNGVEIPYSEERTVSQPYLKMTIDLMKKFGCEVTEGRGSITIGGGECKSPSDYEVEGDWSGASYFYEIALLAPGQDIKIKNLSKAGESVQGDSACEVIFRRLGVETIYHPQGGATLRCNAQLLEDVVESGEVYVLNLNGTPDLVPALAVAFCMAGVKFRFEGVAHLRHKETDRMAALTAELRKLGYVITPGEDTMSWIGERCEEESEVEISTYSDHRMAMAMAPVVIRKGSLRIKDPAVVKKSFPDYWTNLSHLGIIIS